MTYERLVEIYAQLDENKLSELIAKILRYSQEVDVGKILETIGGHKGLNKVKSTPP